MQEIVAKAICFIKEFYKNESSGHDFQHSERVYKTALELAKEESADTLIVSLAALLHDVDDRKVSPETYDNKTNARRFLEDNGMAQKDVSRIITAIKEVEYIGIDSVTPSTIEGMCVQDADRLDALGAIGIARAFTFGGSHARVMYDKDIAPKLNMTHEEYVNHKDGTTINHFYEKLLNLKDLMNTNSGKKEALRRTEFMKSFLDEFNKEVG